MACPSENLSIAKSHFDGGRMNGKREFRAFQMESALAAYKLAAPDARDPALEGIYSVIEYCANYGELQEARVKGLDLLHELGDPKGQYQYAKALLDGEVQFYNDPRRGTEDALVTTLIDAAAAQDYLPALHLRVGQTTKKLRQGLPIAEKQACQKQIEGDMHRCVALGDANAAHSYGVMLYQGTYIPRDLPLSKKMLRKAIEWGSTDAHITLGLCHQTGEDGFRKSPSLALRHFKAAAKKGDPMGLLHAAAINIGIGASDALKDNLLHAFEIATKEGDENLAKECVKTIGTARRAGLLVKNGASFGPTK